MVETGGTKFLRNAGSPNKRVQDGLKAPLLCKTCERETSVFENEFSRDIFIPSIGDGELPKNFKRSTYQFVASVHHRIQTYYVRNSDKLDELTRHERKALLHSIAEIRGYLSGQRYSVSPQKLYLIPFGLGVPNNLQDMPSNWHRYIRRHTEMDLIHSEGGSIFGSYFKIGPWLSFCLIRNNGQPWYGGEVFPTSSKITNKRAIFPPTLHEFMIDRAELAKSATETISDRQQAVINKAVSEADFSGKSKPMLDAIAEDVRVFGNAAFRRTPKTS